MKKLYLLTLFTASLTCQTVLSQNSDDQIYIDQSNKPFHNSYSDNVKIGNINGNITPCDSGSATLSVVGSCGHEWFSDSLGLNSLGTGNLTTPVLYNDSTFYLAGYDPTGSTGAPLPPHSSIFSGNIRGYWFQAPTDFYITGLTVPTEASTANTSAAIVKFNSGPPPSWSATTNDFTVLEYWVNMPDDTLFACHSVDSGQWIGVMGWRGTSNSYAPAPYASTIGGMPVTFTRLGMQFDLNTTAPQDLFSEPSGSLGRATLLYSTTIDTTSSLIQPITVFVPKSSSDSIAVNLCSGQSYFVEGANQTTNGVYYDSLLNFGGCDSIRTVDLTFNPSYSIFSSMNLCSGDSIFLGGSYQTTGGIYYDTLQTILGCDSLRQTGVFVISGPTVTLDPFAVDTICMQAAPFALPNGSPSGGTYVGSGVSGSNFDPNIAGSGLATVSYTYTDTNNCSATANSDVYIVNCSSIGEITLEGVEVYPNPTNGKMNIYIPSEYAGDASIQLFDNQGRLVLTQDAVGMNNSVSIENLSSGVYVLSIQSKGKKTSIRVQKL